jgi:hypothetical protein
MQPGSRFRDVVDNNVDVYRLIGVYSSERPFVQYIAEPHSATFGMSWYSACISDLIH